MAARSLLIENTGIEFYRVLSIKSFKILQNTSKLKFKILQIHSKSKNHTPEFQKNKIINSLKSKKKMNKILIN